MSKVAVVTDSTATIPKEIMEEYSIWEAPQVVIFGEETLEDRIDIQPSEFYDRLVMDPHHPTTSQATPASFEKIARLIPVTKTSLNTSPVAPP